MGVLSNKISREDLKTGDHIYSWRQAYVYAHHGIYIGGGTVIHFTRGGGQEIGTGTFLDRIITSSSPSRSSENPCPNCGHQSRVDGVILSCIDCFLSGGDLYKFEYGVTLAFFLAQVRGGTCTLAQSDSTEDVLHRASFLLEKGFGGYDIFKNNCEDFAIYCKTGFLVTPEISFGCSGQAGSFLAAASIVVPYALRSLTIRSPAVTAVRIGMYCVNRYASDVGVRRDVSKIPVERLVSASILDEAEASTIQEKTK